MRDNKEKINAGDLRPVRYVDDKLFILDQTQLPGREEYVELKTLEEIMDAIKKLKVRGAPAIGVAAAFGVLVALKERGYPQDLLHDLREICGELRVARPTAVNLAKAVDRMLEAGLGEEKLLEGIEAINREWVAGEKEEKIEIAESEEQAGTQAVLERLKQEAEAIQREDEEANFAMGQFGLSLMKPGMGILTHCNAGALATSRYGTALSPIYLANERGYEIRVFADETRPLLQGARLTAWELNRAGVDVTLICDNMAQTVMRKGLIDAIFVGCDRMAANGDGANKIGTAGLAILAKEFGIPFYMFVPTSTIDLNTPTGDEIGIELRSDDEIKEMWYNTPMAPEGVKTFNPAFDVTPHDLITAVVTEKGIVRPPFDIGLREIMERR